MVWIIYSIIDSVFTVYFTFIVLDIRLKNYFSRFIIIVLLFTFFKVITFHYWYDAGLALRMLACTVLQVIACFLLLRRSILYVICCISMEYVVLQMCKFIIFLMLGTSPEEMYKFETAIKICSYLQSLIILLVVVNFKQQEIISNKDFYIKNADNALFLLRRQKHNFDNVLNTIYGLVNLEQYNKLGEFIKVAQTECNELHKCKNVCLSALITQKINAFGDKAKVYLKIRSGLDNLNITDNELCECVGILLDNAFEAAVLTEDPCIAIEMFEVMDDTVIKIRNTCREIIDKKMFFKKGYSTKGKGRGIGLFIVKTIMNKYGNDLDVMVNGNEVVISLIIHPGCKTSEIPNLLKNRIPAAWYSRMHEKA